MSIFSFILLKVKIVLALNFTRKMLNVIPCVLYCYVIKLCRCLCGASWWLSCIVTIETLIVTIEMWHSTVECQNNRIDTNMYRKGINISRPIRFKNSTQVQFRHQTNKPLPWWWWHIQLYHSVVSLQRKYVRIMSGKKKNKKNSALHLRTETSSFITLWTSEF